MSMNLYRIQRVYRIKVVAKDWFPNGSRKTGITGRLEFIQETPFSPVKTHVMLKGLEGIVSNYHVHQVIQTIEGWSRIMLGTYRV